MIYFLGIPHDQPSWKNLRTNWHLSYLQEEGAVDEEEEEEPEMVTFGSINRIQRQSTTSRNGFE